MKLQLCVLCLITTSVFAQAATEKPFVQYPKQPAAILSRLHSQKGALAWRKDYPGGFTAWQRDAQIKLRELLGLYQIQKETKGFQPSVKLEPAKTARDHIRQRGTMITEPGVSIPFWVLRPIGSLRKKRPVILCAHGHDSNGWNTYAGAYTDEKHREQTETKQGNPGIQAVRKGYIAVVPATRGLAKVTSIPDPKGRHGNRPCRAQLIHCLLAGRTPIGERVWDTQQIIDWIVNELPGADASKVVMLGNSGGGVLTVYTAALDDRIAVAVPSCSFTSYTSSTGFIFHCDCCLVPRAQTELCDLSDIGALAAPRPVLAVHGRQDGLHHFPDVERAMKRVKSVYAAVKAPNSFQHRWGNKGHKFYPDLMWPFIDKHMKK